MGSAAVAQMSAAHRRRVVDVLARRALERAAARAATEAAIE